MAWNTRAALYRGLRLVVTVFVVGQSAVLPAGPTPWAALAADSVESQLFDAGGSAEPLVALAAANSIVTADSSPNVGSYTSIALDAGGNPVVSYYDGTERDLKVLHCGNPSCSSGNTIATPDSAGDVGKWTSLALDSAGNPVVSYQDRTQGDLKVLHCGNPTCTVGNIIATPDSAGVVGSYTSIALDASGHPVVSYIDETNRALKLLHCGDATCTTGNVITSPVTSGNGAWFTSLKLDAHGNPVIAFYNVADHWPQLLHCANPDCTGADNRLTVLDPSFDVGTGISLALDGAGNPVASYYDQANGDLKVAHCANPNCLGGTTYASPDTNGDVGRETQLLLDAAGNPVISYQDFDHGLLKIVHCSDPACVGSTTIAAPDPTLGGNSNALALDSNGDAVVSYQSRAVTGELRLLHCGNASCQTSAAPAAKVAITSITPAVPRATAAFAVTVGVQAASGAIAFVDQDVTVTLSRKTGSGSLQGTTTATLRRGTSGVIFGNLTYSKAESGVVLTATATAGGPLTAGDSAPFLVSGDTITLPDTAGDVGSFTAMALDSSGYPVVSYFDATNGQVKLLRCGNAACSAGNSIAVLETVGSGSSYTSLALDAAGNPVVSYWAAGQLKVAHCGNTTCTSGNTIAAPDPTFNVGLFNSMALDAAGRPVVSYYSFPGGNLSVLHCGDAHCSGGNTVVSPATAFVNGSSLVLDAAGNPVVSYADSQSRAFHLLHCGSPTCSSGNSITTVDADQYAGQYNSLALDAAGNPVMSYVGPSGDLRLVHCGNPTCTSGNVTAYPSTDGLSHLGTSLAIDTAGHPAIAYATGSIFSPGRLKLLRCGDATCSSGNVTTEPDDALVMGAYPSLRLDGANRPVVAYWDTAQRDLRVLHCSSPTCAAADQLAVDSLSLSTLGANAPDTTVTMHGAGFQSGATVVSTSPAVATVTGSTTVLSGSTLTFQVHPVGAGATTFAMTNPDGTHATSGPFTVNPAPTITGISRSTVEVSGGLTEVVISGAGFVAGAAIVSTDPTVVRMVSLAALSPTSVRVLVMPGTAGATTFKVTNTDGGNAVSSGFTVTAAAAPFLAWGVQPVRGAAGLALGFQPEVVLKDANGAVQSASNGLSVTLVIAPSTGPAGATLMCSETTGGLTTATTASGRASFHACVVDSPGADYQLQASATGVASGLSGRFNVVLAGDTNGDCRVTILDFSLVVTHFGKSSTYADWNDPAKLAFRADINGDARVTILDFSIVVSRFGRFTDTCPPASDGAALLQ